MNAVVASTMNTADTRVLVTIANNLDQRLGTTVTELARTQEILKQASESLRTSFRSAAALIPASSEGLERVQVHLNQAVTHLQSHDLVNQLIDAQKNRVQTMREKLQEAVRIASEDEPENFQRLIETVIESLDQVDEVVKAPSTDATRQGSVDLF